MSMMKILTGSSKSQREMYFSLSRGTPPTIQDQRLTLMWDMILA